MLACWPWNVNRPAVALHTVCQRNWCNRNRTMTVICSLSLGQPLLPQWPLHCSSVDRFPQFCHWWMTRQTKTFPTISTMSFWLDHTVYFTSRTSWTERTFLFSHVYYLDFAFATLEICSSKCSKSWNERTKHTRNNRINKWKKNCKSIVETIKK